MVAPIGGVLMRCPEEGQSDGGQGTKEFVKLDDYVTGRFDSQQRATCIMAIADLSRLIVKLSVNEVDILKFRERMPVTVTVDALPNDKFPGTVTLISRQAEEGAASPGRSSAPPRHFLPRPPVGDPHPGHGGPGAPSS